MPQIADSLILAKPYCVGNRDSRDERRFVSTARVFALGLGRNDARYEFLGNGTYHEGRRLTSNGDFASSVVSALDATPTPQKPKKPML